MGARLSAAVLRVATIAVVVVGGTMPAVAAPTPSFTNVSVVAQDQHDVAVTFTESGVAPLGSVTERLRALAVDSYACYDATGRRAGSMALVEHPTNQGAFQANAAGTIDSATITTSVSPLDVCPRGEASYLYKTVFGTMVLTDLTNGVTVRVRGRSTSCSPDDCVPPVHL
jgi:hypothetical protein